MVTQSDGAARTLTRLHIVVAVVAILGVIGTPAGSLFRRQADLDAHQQVEDTRLIALETRATRADDAGTLALLHLRIAVDKRLDHMDQRLSGIEQSVARVEGSEERTGEEIHLLVSALRRR